MCQASLSIEPVCCGKSFAGFDRLVGDSSCAAVSSLCALGSATPSVQELVAKARASELYARANEHLKAPFVCRGMGHVAVSRLVARGLASFLVIRVATKFGTDSTAGSGASKVLRAQRDGLLKTRVALGGSTPGRSISEVGVLLVKCATAHHSAPKGHLRTSLCSDPLCDICLYHSFGVDGRQQVMGDNDVEISPAGVEPTQRGHRRANCNRGRRIEHGYEGEPREVEDDGMAPTTAGLKRESEGQVMSPTKLRKPTTQPSKQYMLQATMNLQSSGDEARGEMGVRGKGGKATDTDTLTHLAWADDVWLYANSLEDLNAMLRDVATAAYEEIGLRIRWEKSYFAKVSADAPECTPKTSPQPFGRVEFAKITLVCDSWARPLRWAQRTPAIGRWSAEKRGAHTTCGSAPGA